MIGLDIRIPEDQKREMIRALERAGKSANKAMALAVNRAADSGQAELVRQVSQRYQISPSKIRPELRVKKASAENLEAKITSFGQGLPLYDFKITPKGMPKRKPKILQVGILKGETKDYLGGFVTQMKSGHIGVFGRELGKVSNKSKATNKNGIARKVKPMILNRKIKEQFSLSVPQMAGHDEVMDKVSARVSEVLESRMVYEMERALGGK